MQYTVPEVVRHFGNQTDLAEKMRVTRQAVSTWIVRESIPAKHTKTLERLSAGKFNAKNLPLFINNPLEKIARLEKLARRYKAKAQFIRATLES